MKPKKVDLAWAAGFFDGEGTVRVCSFKKQGYREYKKLSVSVAQCHREVLDRFLVIVRKGKVYGPYDNKSRNGHKNNKPYFVYSITGKHSKEVIEKIRPWLGGVKREQADRALAEVEEYDKHPKIPSGPKTKLTPNEIEEIKALSRAGARSIDLAHIYNTSSTTIWGIKKGVRIYAK